MNDKDLLLAHIDQVQTTVMGMERIQKNLRLTTEEPVAYCKSKMLDQNCHIYRQGKNYYCECDNIKITVNAHSYTIITAHIMP